MKTYATVSLINLFCSGYLTEKKEKCHVNIKFVIKHATKRVAIAMKIENFAKNQIILILNKIYLTKKKWRGWAFTRVKFICPGNGNLCSW